MYDIEFNGAQISGQMRGILEGEPVDSKSGAVSWNDHSWLNAILASPRTIAVSSTISASTRVFSDAASKVDGEVIIPSDSDEKSKSAPSGADGDGDVVETTRSALVSRDGKRSAESQSVNATSFSPSCPSPDKEKSILVSRTGKVILSNALMRESIGERSSSSKTLMIWTAIPTDAITGRLVKGVRDVHRRVNLGSSTLEPLVVWLFKIPKSGDGKDVVVKILEESDGETFGWYAINGEYDGSLYMGNLPPEGCDHTSQMSCRGCQSGLGGMDLRKFYSGLRR